jgi:hypothetical protein
MTLTSVLGYLAAFLAGGTIGFLACALCVAAGGDDAPHREMPHA